LKAEPSLLNEKDEEGYTPLHLAVIAGNTSIVKFLISQGADYDAVDTEMHSAIHWATGKNVNMNNNDLSYNLNLY
jgi:ankyrin repeat protein